MSQASASVSIAAGPDRTHVAVWPQLVRRREFWIIQALVLGIAVGHTANELVRLVDLRAAEILPASLFLIPVSYAALVFGLRGAVATAGWSMAVTLPNVVYWHTGSSAAGELWQAGLVAAAGAALGRRVDLERDARGEAEARAREQRASDDRYRGLFETVADPVLVLDAGGRVIEANSTAVGLFQRPIRSVRGATLDTWLPELRGVRLDGETTPDAPIAIDRHDRRRWLHPVAIAFEEADGEERLLIQLRDVTPAVDRQHLLESLAARTVAAREEERHRVARDLHDGPLQSLVVLSRSLESGVRGRQPVDRTLREARQQAAEVCNDLRRFSRDLRPSILDDLGLAPAMKAVVANWSARSDVTASFELRGRKARLPSEIEVTLLRICQEALRNVERHARAERATVVLSLQGRRYAMRICDDGVGIGELPMAADLVQDGRLGVVGMRERARLIGATFRIRPLVPSGTEVRVAGAVGAN